MIRSNLNATVVTILLTGIILDYLTKLDTVSLSGVALVVSLYLLHNSNTKSSSVFLLIIFYSGMYGIFLQQNLGLMLTCASIALLVNEISRQYGWMFLAMSLGFFNVWVLLLALQGFRYTVIEVILTVALNIIVAGISILVINAFLEGRKKSYA